MLRKDLRRRGADGRRKSLCCKGIGGFIFKAGGVLRLWKIDGGSNTIQKYICVCITQTTHLSRRFCDTPIPRCSKRATLSQKESLVPVLVRNHS